MLLSRPISVAERTHLLAFGARLEALRNDAEMSRSNVAVETGLNPQTIYRIERGVRRTRRRTLTIIVDVLADDPAGVLSELARLAGRALAEESPFVDRIERRRVRRVRRHQVLRDREAYLAERVALEAEWRRRTELHLEFRAAIRLFSRSFDWLYKCGYFDERGQAIR